LCVLLVRLIAGAGRRLRSRHLGVGGGADGVGQLAGLVGPSLRLGHHEGVEGGEGGGEGGGSDREVDDELRSGGVPFGGGLLAVREQVVDEAFGGDAGPVAAGGVVLARQ
jgi:hypothetical protein